MSRAFVKENDLEHAGIDIPERPLSDAPNYVTPNGLQLLNQKIDALEMEREKLKQKGWVNSYSDEDTEEMFFLTEEGGGV